MSKYLLLVTILLPIISSIFIYRFKDEKKIRIITLTSVCLTSILLLSLIIFGVSESYTVLKFTDRLNLDLNLDGLGKYFGCIIALLWPLTTLYGFEYLEHDKRLNTFFMFFNLAYGATIGVALSNNFFTLYMFYELLTLSTMPLVMFTKMVEAIRASRVYLALSIGGAAFGFGSMMYQIMNPEMEKCFLTSLFYLFGFFGFGVKAAVFPMHIWLPKASCAPTPVTALLHAVAVVKAGVFAIIRLTYYGYGVSVLEGTFAQYIPLVFVIFTIVFGSSKALKEIHFKRRMAYSTVANLSYILFGVLLMSNFGLAAGLLHMAYHAVFKILGFFCVGAFMHKSHKNYIMDLDGVGYKMPITFICYGIAALALTGIPPFTGFISKFYLLDAAVKNGTVLSYLGFAAILISALLTALYSLTPLRRAFFPDTNTDLSIHENTKEAGPLMCVPMILLALSIVICGLYAQPLVDVVNKIALSVRW